MNLESLASTVPEEQEAEGEAGDDGSAQGAGGVGKDEHRSSVAFRGVPSGGAIPGGGILRSVGVMDHPGSRVEQAVCPRKRLCEIPKENDVVIELKALFNSKDFQDFRGIHCECSPYGNNGNNQTCYPYGRHYTFNGSFIHWILPLLCFLLPFH